MKKARYISPIMMLIMAPFLTLQAYVPEEIYTEPGEWWEWEEYDSDEFYEGMWFLSGFSEHYEHAVMLSSPIIYILDDGDYMNGGYYMGELVVPDTVYGLFGFEHPFIVDAVDGMYKNGLTSLYLPETIHCIAWTIEECRYLERVHLNNSLRVLNGVRDCPVLTDCPLPLSLEEIGDGWMSGIAISETELPESLRIIGRGCFSRLPNLREISLPETLEVLGAGSFSDCPALERIVLPSTPILSEGSFRDCPSVREVSVYAQTPYEFPADCMAETDKGNCTLYVPEGCEEAYAVAEGWKEFGHIAGSLPMGISSFGAERGEWRAFGSRGHLVVDSTCGASIEVYSASGQHMATVTERGRNELTLPQGLYVVSSRGKTMKVRL